MGWQIAATAGLTAIQIQQQGAIGKSNQEAYNVKADAVESDVARIEKQKEFDIAQFNKDFSKLVGAETVALSKAGVTREGTSLRLSRQNAEEAQLQRNIITYNSKVAQTQKINEANYLRYSGQVARAEAKMAQVSTAIKGVTSIYSMGGFENKSLLQNNKSFAGSLGTRGTGMSGYGGGADKF